MNAYKNGEIRKCFSMPPSMPSRIRSICIPSRDRAACLDRAVSSYAGQLNSLQDIEIIVADDSRDPAECEKNKEVLRRVKKSKGANLLYMDRSRREAYARELATAADVPEEVVKFAVLGDDRCASTYGASRNSLLLETAGDLTLQVDDDTICQIAKNPDHREGLMVAHDERDKGMWFNPDFNSLEYVDADVLALHGLLLGKKPVDCMAAHTAPLYTINTAYFNESLRKHINNEEATIKATFMGLMGDSGMRNNIPVLLSEGESHLRLVSDPDQYQARLNGRDMLNSSPQTCISRAGSCQTMNIGLDNREDLHPFIPVGANEDAIFSVVLYACFPASFVGYLPYQLMHAPPDKRSYVEDVGMQPPSMNHLLQMLVHTLREYLTSPTSSENIFALGSLLKEITSVKADMFEDYVYHTYQQKMSRFIESLKKRVEEEPVAPAYWKEDVQKLSDSIKKSLTRKTFFGPGDLPGTYHEKLSVFRELVSMYGRLLLHWPVLFEVAKSKRKEDRRLASPI